MMNGSLYERKPTKAGLRIKSTLRHLLVVNELSP
jgi:hypothetical protein